MEIRMEYIYLIVLAIAQICDSFTTYKVLSHGGIELNSLLASLFSRFGMVPVLAVMETLIMGFAVFIVFRVPLAVGVIPLYTGAALSAAYRNWYEFKTSMAYREGK